MTLELCFVLAALAMLLALFALGLWRVQSKQIKQLVDEVALLAKALALYKDSGQGLGSRLAEVERKVQGLVRSQALGNDASQQAKYLKASELLAAGSEHAGIAQECDMTINEVKLLQLMQRKDDKNV